MDLERLRRNRFLLVGRAGLDLYADPPGTKTERAERFTAALGGSAANTAAAISRLGGEATLVTTVSDDAVGRYTLNALESYGIDTRHIRSVGGEARNTLAVVETTIEDHQSVIYRNGAADFEMTRDDIRAIDFEAYGGVIVTGTALAAEPSRSATFQALAKAHAANVPAIIDVDYRPYSWPSPEEASEVCTSAARQCDIVVGNDDEFAVMAGEGAHGEMLAEARFDGAVSIAIYKMGERGSRTYAEDQTFETGIFPVTALKPTGAGDSFLGAFVASLAAGHDLESAVTRGSAAAAIVVTRVGCAPAMPTTDELDEFIEIHPGPTRT